MHHIFHQIWKCKRREITLCSWSWCSFSFLWHPYGPKLGLSSCITSHQADTWGSRTERYNRSLEAERYRHFCEGHCSCLAKSRYAASLTLVEESQKLLQQGYYNANVKPKGSESLIQILFTTMEVKLGMERNYFHNFGEALLFAFYKSFP